jgi:ribonuclease-3
VPPPQVVPSLRVLAPPALEIVADLPEPTQPVQQSELSPEEQRGLDELAARLQISFRRPALLREAMTHASWNNERGEPSGPGHDNERLEYLGDAVLELVVGEYLFRRFPGYDEGKLTQLRAALVNTISLAKLGERLHLGDTLLLGRGAAKTGARQLPSLLANCFEAMIGAIFLDQGYRVATRVFLQSIGDLSEWSDENHKGRLQEAAQLRLGATPAYRVSAIGGPGHRREYRAEAVVAGKVLGDGRGSTKQAAEQAAARLAMERLEAPEGRRPAPVRARRPATVSKEPARVRRRVAEVAADRRAASRPAAAVTVVDAASPEAPRSRGLLGALRAAAQVLVGHRGETSPLPATPPEPSPPAAHRSHRGHRGGRGRRRPAPPPGAGSGPSAPTPSGPSAPTPHGPSAQAPPGATPSAPSR